MSKADEMFDEIKYRKIHDNKRHIVYSNGLTKIEFKIKYKWINVDLNMDMQELQAINEKCKELGWL